MVDSWPGVVTGQVESALTVSEVGGWGRSVNNVRQMRELGLSEGTEFRRPG